MFCRAEKLKYFWWGTSDRFLEMKHFSGVKLCHGCQAILSNKVKNIFHPVLSCSVLLSVQWEEKRVVGDETRQRVLILNYSETFFHGKYQMGALPGKQCFFIQCHPPCSLTTADEIRRVFPGCSSLPALFSCSSLPPPCDIGLSCS